MHRNGSYGGLHFVMIIRFFPLLLHNWGGLLFVATKRVFRPHLRCWGELLLFCQK